MSAIGAMITAAGAHDGAARAAMAQARNNAAQEREKYKKLAASQRAAIGASGLDVNEGGALSLLAGTDAQGEAAAGRHLYSGALQAWQERQKAAAARARASQGILGGVSGGLANLAGFMRGVL